MTTLDIDVDRVDFISEYVHKRELLDISIAEDIHQLGQDIIESSDNICDVLDLLTKFTLSHELKGDE